MQNIYNEQDAQSMTTSIEILAAICKLSDSPEMAERIWSAATEAEVVSIIEIVTCNGLNGTEPTDYYWGDCGNNWAPVE